MKQTLTSVFFLNSTLILSLVSSNSYACSYRRHSLASLNSSSAIMETSENKQYLVKLIPSRWRMGKTKYDFIKKKESYGVVFKISETGQLQYLWSTKGIYPEDRIKRKSFKIYLSNNGKSIIRVNENPTILISEKGKISAPDNDAITVFKKRKDYQKTLFRIFYFKLSYETKTKHLWQYAMA